MVELIVGMKGKGKTKVLLDGANAAIKDANGSIVYLDKSTKHMYELNNKVRLINVADYPIANADQFVGFICGIISQDHDLEAMYLDGFIKCSKVKPEEITETIKELDAVSRMFNIEFTISLSLDKEELDSSLEDMILVAL